MRRSVAWRWVLAAAIAVHAAIHVLGAVEGLGLADVPELTEPVGTAAGVLWTIAAVAMATTGVALLVAPDRWWLVGLPAVLVSQVAIVGSWTDARLGTVANVVVAAVAVHGAARDGPLGLRARYGRLVAEHVPEAPDATVVTEDDLSPLPPPLRRYLRASGAVGRPRVRHFRAALRGRIRSGPDAPWMDFTVVQHNVVGAPARFFLMDAERGGLPVDVLHVYTGGTATMEVRLLSLVRIVHAAGPEMDRAETVTVFNDLCALAPGALVDPRLRWEGIDDRSVRGWFTVGPTTVTATLHFDERDRLVDFVSDDRLAMAANGADLTSMRWSTPLSDHHDLRGRPIWRRGEARWHPADAPSWSYLEAELTDVETNPSGTVDPVVRTRAGVPA